MKKFKVLLAVVTFAACFSASALDFRIGPKVGFGIGTVTGLKNSSTEVAVGFPVGALAQLDFGSFAIDAGLNYRYSLYATVDREDTDGDNEKDTTTNAYSFSSIELPVVAYYKLGVGPGFFKFGGGLGLDYGFGKVRVSYKEENTNSLDVDTSDTISFDDAGIKKLDVYLIAAFGYQFLFDSWALSIDFQPKYGLVDRVKSTVSNPDNDKWHSLWFDLGVGFLF